jgi:nucleoid-associated protein YgaU
VRGRTASWKSLEVSPITTSPSGTGQLEPEELIDPTPGGMMATDDRPKADFSDVESGSSSTAANPQGRSYTVKKGDSLSKIAQREYGDLQQWHRIYEANRDTIKDPDKIFPGQVIRIPQA